MPAQKGPLHSICFSKGRTQGGGRHKSNCLSTRYHAIGSSEAMILGNPLALADCRGEVLKECNTAFSEYSPHRHNFQPDSNCFSIYGQAMKNRHCSTLALFWVISGFKRLRSKLMCKIANILLNDRRWFLGFILGKILPTLARE